MVYIGPPSPSQLSGTNTRRPTGAVSGPPSPSFVGGPATLKSQFDVVRSTLTRLKKRKAALRTEIARLQNSGAPADQVLLLEKREELAEVSKQEAAALKRSNLLSKAIRDLDKVTTTVAANTRGGGGNNNDQPTTLQEDKSAKMNLSACKDLYFRGTEEFMTSVRDVAANAPGRPSEFRNYLADTSFKTAETLWSAGVATKGRIQTYIPPKSSFKDSASADNDTGGVTKSRGRRMFQFHYNPGSVGMSYGSVAGVDLGQIVSSEPLSNMYSALGTIQFELLINRMPDMKYISSTDDHRKDGINYLEVYDRTPITDTTGGRPNELRDIYNKGTMYDVEFLLKILMGGVSYRSWLRGNDLTSDLGFAIPQPVELHLGNRLRYVISVTNFSLKHVIFNDRMVPLFTTLSIAANRIPADAIGTTNTDLNNRDLTSGGN